MKSVSRLRPARLPCLAWRLICRQPSPLREWMISAVRNARPHRVAGVIAMEIKACDRKNQQNTEVFRRPADCSHSATLIGVTRDVFGSERVHVMCRCGMLIASREKESFPTLAERAALSSGRMHRYLQAGAKGAR